MVKLRYLQKLCLHVGYPELNGAVLGSVYLRLSENKPVYTTIY